MGFYPGDSGGGGVGNNVLNPACQAAPVNHDATLAVETEETDISAEPDDLPFVAAAGMLFLEANHVT